MGVEIYRENGGNLAFESMMVVESYIFLSVEGIWMIGLGFVWRRYLGLVLRRRLAKVIVIERW